MTKPRRVAQTAFLPLLFTAVLETAEAQIDTDAQRRARRESGQQQQREQLQRQTEERQQLQQAPDGRLSGAVDDNLQNTVLPAEQSCFLLSDIALDLPEQLSTAQRRQGSNDLSQDPFHFLQQAVAVYRGRCVGYAGVNLIHQRLSALIEARGYATTRLGIAAQDLSSGRLVLSLIPGIIRTISFGAPDIDGSWKTAFPVRPGDLFNLHDLEQGLEQLKRIPGREVDMRVVPGERSGESDIVLDVHDLKPWRLAASLDDSGARGTGQLQAGLNLAIDNPLGLNDLLRLGVSNDAQRLGSQGGSSGRNLSYSVPYGYWTFGMAASSYAYHQEVAGRYQTFVFSGKGRNLEVKVNRLFQRSQEQKNSLQFRLGKRWSRTYLDNHEIEGQRRNATYAELAWVHKHYLGSAQLDVTLANRWGVSWFNGDADQPARAPDIPTTRYTLQTLDAALMAPFQLGSLPLTYSAVLRAQHTQSNLYATEQFSIGNRYTVRGFDGELSLSAERGMFLRNEVDLPLGGSGQSVYAGLDVGKVWGPSVQYLLGDKLAGAAVGARGSVRGLGYDLFLGWALYKPRHFRTRSPAAGFSLAYQY